MTAAVYTELELSEHKRPQLNKLAKKLGITSLAGKNEDLIERMVTKSKSVRCTWDNDGDLVAPKSVEVVNGKRTHPVMGEYKEVIIRARKEDIVDEQFNNGHYAARIIMGEPVKLPEGFIKFITTACVSIDHYYDENKINPETGQLGLHTSRSIPEFYVTYL